MSNTVDVYFLFKIMPIEYIDNFAKGNFYFSCCGNWVDIAKKGFGKGQGDKYEGVFTIVKSEEPVPPTPPTPVPPTPGHDVNPAAGSNTAANTSQTSDNLAGVIAALSLLTLVSAGLYVGLRRRRDNN